MIRPTRLAAVLQALGDDQEKIRNVFQRLKEPLPNDHQIAIERVPDIFLSHLTGVDEEIIRLRVLHRLSRKKIAEALGTSTLDIRTRETKALAVFAKLGIDAPTIRVYLLAEERREREREHQIEKETLDALDLSSLDDDQSLSDIGSLRDPHGMILIDLPGFEDDEHDLLPTER